MQPMCQPERVAEAAKTRGFARHRPVSRRGVSRVSSASLTKHVSGRMRVGVQPTPPRSCGGAPTCLRLLAFAYLPSLNMRSVGDRLVSAKMLTSSGYPVFGDRL